MNPSMSEKKSVSGTKRQCSLCLELYWDFIEHYDRGDIRFILCSNCEAMRTSEDLYEAMMDRGYASPREGVFNNCHNPRNAKIDTTVQASQSAEAEIDATKGI